MGKIILDCLGKPKCVMIKEKEREFDYRRGDGDVMMEAETGGSDLKMEKAPQSKHPGSHKKLKKAR